MAVILTHVFSCCLSRKPSKSKIHDEESPFIPPDTEITPSYSSSPGPQVFRERMLDIVRSKESKMVNITATLPFHFHNKNRVPEDILSTGALVDPFSVSPTYSRSASASSLPPNPLSSRPFPPQSSVHASRFYMSRNSSVTFPIDPENQGDERSISSSRVRSSRTTPAFNIRFVRGLRLHHAADFSGVRRGRTRTRTDSENDDDSLSRIPSQTESPGMIDLEVHSTTPSEETTTTTTRQLSPASTADPDIGPLIVGWGN